MFPDFNPIFAQDAFAFSNTNFFIFKGTVFFELFSTFMMATNLTVYVLNTIIRANGLYDLFCFIRPDGISGEKLAVCGNNNDFFRTVVLKEILAA